MWRVKVEREGILDKAAAFEVEVPRVAEGGSALDEETASMAFYARVFVLKVGCTAEGGRARCRIHPTTARRRRCPAAAQGYKMRDEDRDEARDNPDRGGDIRTAVRAWFVDPAAAKAKYGPIASWDTSGIVDMYRLFYNNEDFTEDISRWDVSNVKDMGSMFLGATSFNGDLSRWDVSSVGYVYGGHVL